MNSEKEIENEGKQNSLFLIDNLLDGKILVALQICVKDKLLDQNC